MLVLCYMKQYYTGPNTLRWVNYSNGYNLFLDKLFKKNNLRMHTDYMQ